MKSVGLIPRKFHNESIKDVNIKKVEGLELKPLLQIAIDNKTKLQEQQIKIDQNESKFITFQNCSNNTDIFKVVESVNQSKDILLLKFQTTDDFVDLSSTDLHKLNKVCSHKSAVIIFESKTDENFSIYWKSNEIEEFLILKINEKLDIKMDRMLHEFITDFLVKSIEINHLGLISKLSFQHGMKPVSLDLLADSRDFNLLLLAAENGNSEIVEILLQQGMNTNSLDNKIDAQTLAYQNQHFDVLCQLLQANLKFPASFDTTLCTGKCKEFCEVTEEVHKLIKADDNEKLKVILNQHKNLKHFYNFSNESALKVAILNESYKTYKELTKRKFRYASHEDPAEYLQDLNEKNKKIVREIHNKFSENIVEKHINTLIGNSFIYHDEVDGQDKQDIISRAYKTLDSIPLVRIILKIVAASKNFKIIFDFNRESVNVADPTVDSYTQGLFYVSGRIYVGAMQLLNTLTEHEALANLAHELCHYTMNLVYNNGANPYEVDDLTTENELREISEICEKSAEKEEIIDMVYEAYPEEVHHAELIVRPVHMLVYFQNSPEIVEQKKEAFSRLFEFYERKTYPDMKKALPEIERRDQIVLELKDQKISKLKKVSIIGGVMTILGVIAAIVIGIIFYTPIYSFDELTSEEQTVVSNSSVIYKNVQIQLNDLFPTNSTAYSMLTSDHITQMLQGEILNFTDPYVHYLDELVTHSWTNLTEPLKATFLSSNFTFQDESLKFKILHESNPTTFESLTSQQIIDVLDNKTMIISNMIKNETNFIASRKIFDENIYEIYYGFMHLIHGDLSACRCQCYNNTKNTETFENFYKEFRNKDLNTQLKKINEIRKIEGFSVCALQDYKIYDYPHEEIDNVFTHESLQFNFNDVLKIANETKMFILSAEAGTGKTVTFEQFTMRIKKKLPTRWVSYIDLKDHKDLYKAVETFDDVKEMLGKIFGLADQNKFEKEVFEELFKSGDAILLWNGFDEISPEFSDSVLKILSIIRNNTKNIQFICTRPLYTEQLRDKFMTKTYTLIPFTAEEQENFIKKFLIANKIDKSMIPNYIQKVQKIVDSTQSKEGFDTPLLLGMISELVSSDVEIYETENLYELYRKFVEKKVQIWQENSAFAKKFLNTLVTSGFSIKNLYLKYAMKSELQSGDYSYKFAYFSALKLKIMRQKVPKGLTNDEVSRMGILFINGPKTFKFAHRTFAEFFVAQYLVENIYYADDEPTDEEAERRIRVLYQTFSYPYFRIRGFIESFLKTQSANETQVFDAKISNVLRTKFQRIYFNSMQDFNEINLLEFFAKDNNVFTELLQINADETLYTASFNYLYYLNSKTRIVNHEGIAAISKQYLNDSQYETFISGKNQKGIIQWSSYWMSRKILQSRTYGTYFHKNYTLDDEFLKNGNSEFVFESIVKNLTESELKALLTSEIILRNAFFDETMWNLIEENLTKQEQKNLLLKFFKLTSILKHGSYKLALEKFQTFSNNSEIYEIFFKSNILNTIANFGSYNFDPLWNFFVNHSNFEQQKTILKQSVQNECFLRTFKDFDLRYCYVFPPLNMLQSSIFSFDDLYPFEHISSLYATYFNRTEIQEIILSGTFEFFPLLVVQGDQKRCEYFFGYLRRIFTGSEDVLKNFLLQKIEPTNLDVFELMSDYNDHKNCVELFTQFLDVPEVL
ncbi:unnamed protein product [Chironomus riparius]|uniref:Uncharacterized protein n=1 Tax=Chironomus riparius TaxID=315576 RepID=A0A9N9RY03_9DIPT|nr:unnamed protein product [Chironomus riparius]